MNKLISHGALALLASLALTGCVKESGGHHAHDGHDHSGHDHDHDHSGHDHAGHAHDEDRAPDVYEGIRGEIVSLPDPSTPGSELRIRHEQIRDFKTVDGTVNVSASGIAGMASMTMPFPLGTGMSLDGFAVGDKVEFDFTVNWGGGSRPAWFITRIGKLPVDTALDYTNAIEEASGEDAGHDHDDHAGHDHDGHDHDGP